MTDLDRLLEIEMELKTKQIHEFNSAMTLEKEFESLKSKIEQDLENHTKGVEYHKLAYEKVKQLEQQVVSLKETNKELRVQLHNSTQSLKDEIKQLKEDNEVLKLGEQESWSHYKINKQKLEKIEALFKYGVPTGLKECGKLCFELKEILRGKEE